MPVLLVSALSAGHAAFLFICLSGDFFTFVSQVRCLYCWCPPFPLAMQHFYSFVSQVISLLLSPRLGACTAGVCPYPLAMQHFYSFVSQVISLLLSPRFGACNAGVRPFPLAMQHYYSFVSQVISLLLSPRFGACTAGVRPFRWPCSISIHLSLR